MAPSLWFEIGADMAPFNRAISSAVTKATQIGTAAIAAGLTAVGVAIAYVGKEALTAAADVEVYTVTLAQLMGTTKGAADRMEELARFAAVTPFNLEDLIKTEVALRAVAGTAAEQLLPGVVDLAAGMKAIGYTVTQAGIDMAKAWNLGSTAMEGDAEKIVKNMVMVEAGLSNALELAKLPIEEFRKHLLSVLNGGQYAGMSKVLSGTMTGIISNLQDAWAEFLRDVSKGDDYFRRIKAVAMGLLIAINDNAAAIEDMAHVLGSKLWTAFTVVAKAAALTADAIDAGIGFAYGMAAGVDAIQVAYSYASASALTFLSAVQKAAGLDQLSAVTASLARAHEGIRAEASARLSMHLAEAKAHAENGSYYDATIAQLNAAEAAASAFADEVDRATGGDKTAKKAGEKGGKGAKDTAAQAETDAAATAYADFFASLALLRETDTEAAQRWADEQMDILRDMTANNLDSGVAYMEGRVLIEDELAARLLEIRKRADADEMALEDKAWDRWVDNVEKQARAEEDAQNTRIRNMDQTVDSTASMLDSLAGLMDQSQADQKAAYKAFSITSAIISAAAAIARQYADLPVYAAIPASIAVAAATGAQIAAIASAHQGGVVSRQPDETDRRLLVGEGVVSRSVVEAAGGPQGLQQMEFGAGDGGGGGGASMTLSIGRYQWREMVRRDARTGGPLSQVVSSAALSSGVAVGMSGRAAS